MIVFRYATVIKLIAIIFALKNERIISKVKGLCLNRPDRFLQISVVCEFSQPSGGLMRAV